MLEKVKLFVGGKESFDHIIKNINQAKKHIRINMFIWRDDVIGNKIALALINAANRGVKIHISKDRVGMAFEYGEELKHSFFHHQLYTRWYIQGLMLDKMYPMEGKTKRLPKEENINYTTMMSHKNITVDCQRAKKDHSKYYIFDHEILVLGGVNIEDKEVTADVMGREYHDYMVEVTDTQSVTLFKKRLFGHELYNAEAEIDFIYNRFINGKKDFQVKESLIGLLNSAEKSVDITMAYIGDPDIANCITQLCQRGIKVTMCLPGDANIQHDYNMKKLKNLMISTNNKMEVYLAHKMIHAKLIQIDDHLITLGSTNLNKLAMSDLLELNIVINNRETSLLNEFFTKLENSISDLKAHAIKIEDDSEISYHPVKAFLEGLVQ